MGRASRRSSPGAPKTARGGRAEAPEEAAQDMDEDDLQNSDPTMDSEESFDGSFSTRFSASRLREVADVELNDKKRALLEKSSFGSLMNISPFSVPLELIDWVVMKIDTKRSLFSHKKKTILFTRHMVHKIFNIPCGPRTVELLKRNERCEMRNIYRTGARAPMKKSISVIKEAADDDAITIERTWVLLCLALVLVPGTGNMVCMDYLASLKDMDELNEFGWDEHVLATSLREARKYQLKREAGASGFWIGGCLPMFALIYMDFLEVPRPLVSEGTFNYSLPRACFVCDADFKLVIEFDRNKLTLEKVEFGKRNHRPLSQTPYAILDADKQCEGQNQHYGANANNRAAKISSTVRCDGDLGGDFCGTLDEWLQPLPSCEELEIPLHLKPIYEKHKKLYMAELKNVVTSFGQVLQSTFCKRLGHMLLEAHSNAASNHRSDGGDVTFVVPIANATSSKECTRAASFGIPTATAAGVDVSSSTCPLPETGPSSAGAALKERECNVSKECTGAASFVIPTIPTAIAAGVDVSSSTCPLPETGTGIEANVDDQDKTSPSDADADLKERECNVLGGKVGVEAEHKEVETGGQRTSATECFEGDVLQQVNSSDHFRGKDCVEQEEVVMQGGKVIHEDAHNIDPSGAADNVETPVLSQGTLQAMALTALEWEDGPSCSLFPEGSEDYEWLNQKVGRPVNPVQKSNASTSVVPNSTSSGPTFDKTPHFERPSNTTPATVDTAPKLPRPNDIPGPVFDVSPISFQTPSSDRPHEVNVEVRDGFNSHVKQSKKKRAALSPDNVPMMKKIKVDAHGDALHQQYVMTRYPTRKPKKHELLPDFIEIDGFHTSLQNFHASLKPRAEIDNEVMTLYLKTFNYDQLVKKKKPKKFAFSVMMSTKLSAEADVFDPKVCEKEFRIACKDNHVSKCDLLFFTIVHKRHWAVVVVNIMQREFNVFDSIKNSKDLFEMGRITNNVIANIKSVALREPLFKHDLESFTVFSPAKYPRQTSYYNCGYYSILYLENWDGLVMLSFNEEYIPHLRIRIAADLLRHPNNKLDPAQQLKLLLQR